MIGNTKLAALTLPLILLTLLQGGSCGGGQQGGRASGVASNNASAKRNANANTDRNANANKNANAKRNADANTNANANANADARTNSNTNTDSNAGRGGGKDDSTVSENDAKGAAAVAAGAWGGTGVRLHVGGAGAEVEFDCAHGRMGKLTRDARGQFSVRGVFVRERGGPVRLGDTEREEPARFSGRVEGKTMTLTLSFDDGNENSEPLTFTLTQGATGRLRKCL